MNGEPFLKEASITQGHVARMMCKIAKLWRIVAFFIDNFQIDFVVIV